MKILLADDHAVVRQGYRALLAAMISPVTIVEAASGTDAALLYMAEAPDIVILDINMPDMNGIETARQILTRDAQAKILIFSMYEETTVIREALSVGALGYLSKSSPPPLMIEAVNTVMAGKTFIDERFSSVSFGSGIPVDASLLLDQLPPREKDIAQRLIEGKSNHQIAEELGISAKTVANRATAIRQKLGVKSTAELVRKALQN